MKRVSLGLDDGAAWGVMGNRTREGGVYPMRLSD